MLDQYECLCYVVYFLKVTCYNYMRLFEGTTVETRLVIILLPELIAIGLDDLVVELHVVIQLHAEVWPVVCMKL
jgi:hypothetical protein